MQAAEEEYSGQGELNGQVEQVSVEFEKSVVLGRGRVQRIRGIERTG